MTDAQVSQVATEVLRTNLAVTADVSQLAVEVLVSNLSIGAGSASGTASSSFVGDIAVIIQSGTATASGQATVDGIIKAIINSDFASSGLSTVSWDGLAGKQAVASAAGTSSLAWVGTGAGLSIALSNGSSDASAVGGVAASFSAAGSSVAEAVSRFLHSAATQLGDGVSCDDNTQDATGNIGNTGAGITTQIPSTFACGTLTGGFTAGPSGSYVHPSICSETTCHYEESYTPTTPFDPVWEWKPLDKVALCCDISWSGNEIIIGARYGEFFVAGELITSDGYVYLSRDTGASWIKQPIYSTEWKSVTMTANASLLGAYHNQNTVHHISNDGGAGWAAVGHPWVEPIVDAKVCDLGNVFMVGSASTTDGKYIYISKNYAVTWDAVVPFNSNTPLNEQYYGIGDMSSEGMVCYAGKVFPFAPGKMSKSTNYGVTWAPLDASCAWLDISCSGDGKYIIGGGYTFGGDPSGGLLWLSNDQGASFRSLPVRVEKTAMSTTGQVQAYIVNATFYLSKDYGATFNAIPELSYPRSPCDIAINATGSVIVVCFVGDYVYVGTA